MQSIQAYKTADGKLFTDESKAKAHEQDLLGQELDGLLKLFNLDITRQEEYRALLQLMKRQEELKQSVKMILSILEHGEDDESDN